MTDNKNETLELKAIIAEYEKVLPQVYERLKIYSLKSHPGSPSEEAFTNFEKCLDNVAHIKRFGRII